MQDILEKNRHAPSLHLRLSAAERRLKADRDKFPLLANWIEEFQPTAVERLEKFQIEEMERDQRICFHKAKS